jgi:hypothetical protein
MQVHFWSNHDSKCIEHVVRQARERGGPVTEQKGQEILRSTLALHARFRDWRLGTECRMKWQYVRSSVRKRRFSRTGLRFIATSACPDFSFTTISRPKVFEMVWRRL